MKKCPFCAEEIRKEAIKCRYCGEWIVKDEDIKEGNGHVEIKQSYDQPEPDTLVKKQPEPEHKQCPYCKKWDVYKGYIEDGGLGLWCPNCRKSIKIDKGPAQKTAWLSFWIFKLIVGSFIGFIINIIDVLEHRPAFSAIVIIYTIAIYVIIYSFPVSVAIGLIKGRLWAWRANWAIIIGEPVLLALSKIPQKASTDHQLAYFIGSLITFSLLWIWPNYVYFKKRKPLFS